MLYFPYGKMTRRQVTGPEELGALIRQRRVDLRLRQGELADVARVSVRFVSELERGKPSAQFAGIQRVLAALGLDMYLETR